MIRIFKHYVPRMGLILLLMELLLLLAAASLSTLGGPSDRKLSALAFALLVCLAMGALGLYRPDFRLKAAVAMKLTAVRIVPALVLAFCLLRLLNWMAPGLGVGQLDAWFFLLGGGGVLSTRFLLFSSLRWQVLSARLIVVGDGAQAQECLELAAARQGYRRFDVAGCVAVQGEARCVSAGRVLPEGESLIKLARAHGADEIVVALGERRGGAYPVGELLDCVLGGVRVLDAAAFFEREACQIRVDTLQPSYLIFGGGFDQSPLRTAVKRSFDLIASAAIGAATLPLMLATALAILAEDGGPVLYRQERVGKDGRLFQVLKFRSMRRDAERDGWPRWAAEDDPRVTRVGHWLRRLRIDELPQMLNVFRGEMSFVGPRPERAYFAEQLGRELAYYNIRHSIKPGITGLAQVRYRYGASQEDALRKLQYDLYYVKNNSLFLDLPILIDTVQVVLSAKGGR